MSLTVSVQNVQGRPMLVINGRPTHEMWAYGWPNAVRDFTAAGLRICQFHVRGPSWWVGPGTYDFSEIDAQVGEFLRDAPGVLLHPRVGFGYAGEGWWAWNHPDQLAVGLDLDEKKVNYLEVRAHAIENWQSAASEEWVRDASAAMAAFVRHFEEQYGDRVFGYQLGGNISCEWFRWWTYIPNVYEDYSAIAEEAFRRFLRERYGTDDALRAAWNRDGVSLATAVVPRPRELHEARWGFLRDPARERPVLDWLDALSEWNAGQLVALARAAKEACGRQKLVGSFYGYTWPHWNNQNAARSGHLALRKVFDCPDLDYISSPYHYDHRDLGGVHNSQTVPLAVELAGKLHLDEIDTITHLTSHRHGFVKRHAIPVNAAQSRLVLRRDAAAVLGTGGNGWWMDLMHEGWYADPEIQAEVADLNRLARMLGEEPSERHARAAFVVDSHGLACADLHSNHNLYFTSLPRQLLWSDLGFPIDTVLLSDLERAGPYTVYLFLNCWRVDRAARRMIHRCVRRPGVTSIWFHAAGYYDERSAGPEGVHDLTGVRVRFDPTAVVPEIDIRERGHPLLDGEYDTPRGAARFGARLTESQLAVIMTQRRDGWDTPLSPIVEVDDPQAATLGHYAHNGRPGLAWLEQDGWRSLYCGAPMLPGWMVRRVAAAAGVPLYAPPGCVVHHRGAVISVNSRLGGDVSVTAPPSTRLVPLEPTGGDRLWRSAPGVTPQSRLDLRFSLGETRFFRAVPA